MFNHQPKDYNCPFCDLLAGKDTERNQQQDIVYQTEHATAFIAPSWWVENKGHVIVVPNKHYENIYDTPDDVLGEVYKAVKKVSIAIRSTYDCGGTSTRQHNELAGDQRVWHLHVHVYPRYEEDGLYLNHENRMYADAALRAPYAQKLRAFFDEATDV